VTEPISGLPPLANFANAQNLGYDCGSDDQADIMLRRASVRIRSYTRQIITRVTDDVRTQRPSGGIVVLTQRPADKPTLVQVDDGFGHVVTIPVYDWNGRKIRCLHVLPQSAVNALLLRYALPPGYWSSWAYACLCTARQAFITYSHGFTVVPDDVLAITCSVAERIANTTPGAEYGMRSMSLGDYGETYNADSLATAGGLLPGERRTLDEIFGRPRMGSISLSG
jgi:hypothetical protein